MKLSIIFRFTETRYYCLQCKTTIPLHIIEEPIRYYNCHNVIIEVTQCDHLDQDSRAPVHPVYKNVSKNVKILTQGSFRHKLSELVNNDKYNPSKFAKGPFRCVKCFHPFLYSPHYNTRSGEFGVQ